MKLSSRKQLLKEAEEELKKMRNIVVENKTIEIEPWGPYVKAARKTADKLSNVYKKEIISVIASTFTKVFSKDVAMKLAKPFIGKTGKELDPNYGDRISGGDVKIVKILSADFYEPDNRSVLSHGYRIETNDDSITLVVDVELEDKSTYRLEIPLLNEDDDY